jgi:hypothetical protein
MFFGEAKADPEKMSRFLNEFTLQGWEVKTMSVERRRTGLFWSREAYLFVLERPLFTALFISREKVFLVNYLFRLTRLFFMQQPYTTFNKDYLAHTNQ